MKTRKKVLWCILALILIAWIVCAWLFICNENKIKQNSVYCGDKLRQELWEYLENVSMPNATKLDWAYIYTWSVTSEWVNYNFSCKVYSKDNIDLDLEPVYLEAEIAEEVPEINEPEIGEIPTDKDMPTAKMRVLEWQTEEETQAMVEEACSNMWWTWTNGSCMLEDGSYVNF